MLPSERKGTARRKGATVTCQTIVWVYRDSKRVSKCQTKDSVAYKERTNEQAADLELITRVSIILWLHLRVSRK